MPIDKGRALFYEGPFYMFSNFSSFAVLWRGVVWMTSEHAYQAAKFEGTQLWDQIAGALSAHEAFKLARKHDGTKVPNWNEIKLGVMEEIIRAKLEQHSYIQRKLLETDDLLIIEDSPVDSFWGRGPNWRGDNHLGKIWMKLREELKSENGKSGRT